MTAPILGGRKATTIQNADEKKGLLSVKAGASGANTQQYDILITSVSFDTGMNTQILQDFLGNIYHTTFGTATSNIIATCVDIQTLSCNSASENAFNGLKSILGLLAQAKQNNTLPAIDIAYDGISINGYLIEINTKLVYPAPHFTLKIVGTVNA